MPTAVFMNLEMFLVWINESFDLYRGLVFTNSKSVSYYFPRILTLYILNDTESQLRILIYGKALSNLKKLIKNYIHEENTKKITVNLHKLYL